VRVRAAGGAWEVSGTPSERLESLARFVVEGARDGALVVPWRRGDLAEVAVARCLASVQALPYVPDPPGKPFDLVRPAVETQFVGGDCEDLAVLLCALYRRLGVRWGLVWIDQGDWSAPLDHVTAEVFLRNQWFWTDPTVPGARVGEHPYDAVRRTGLDGHRLTG